MLVTFEDRFDRETPKPVEEDAGDDSNPSIPDGRRMSNESLVIATCAYFNWGSCKHSYEVQVPPYGSGDL